MQDDSDAARLERLVETIDARATLRRTWSLRGGISSRMTVLEFALDDSELRRVVLRRPDGALHENPLAAANEFRLLRSLKRVGLPTPAPRLLDESGALFPAPYLVIDYIDGAPDFAANRRDAMAQLASHLVAIHRVELVGTELELLPVYAPRFIHQRDREYPDASLGAARIRDELTRNWAARPKNRPALLHGDYWPGNILWKDGKLVGVVDWEESCIGDPISDLAITRLDLLWAFGVQKMQEFTELYASTSGFDLTDLPYWDLDAALRPVFNMHEWAAAWPGLDRPDITEATMRADHRQFVAWAFDALRVAG